MTKSVSIGRDGEVSTTLQPNRTCRFPAAVVGVAAGDVVAHGRFAGALGVFRGNRDDGGAMTGAKAVKMIQTDAARSDDRTTKLVCQGAWEFSEFPAAGEAGQ